MSQQTTDLDTLNVQFENTYPPDILRWAAQRYGEGLAVVTSFQPTGIVTLHMLSEVAPDTTILTLDTGLLFPETHNLIDEVEARLGLKLIRVRPELSVEQQTEAYGAALWSHQPDLCCGMRKTAPLDKALGGYSAWVTGLRRDQSSGRKTTPIVSWDAKRGNVKISPLATWTEEMVWMYIHAHDLPYNTLHDQNYPTIGCYPCTKAVAPGEQDKRAGRWAGHQKTECGIHIATLDRG